MELQMLSFQKHKRISVVQFMTPDKNTFDYISGMEAYKNDLVKVKEISQSGSVNELVVFNLADKFVFFMDGDILTGAKQNRVLNTSVLLAPNSKVTLPVSCVEQGRWSTHSNEFIFSDFIAPQRLRANKAQAVKDSMDERKVSSGKQSQVWSDVEDYVFQVKCKSPTMNLNDVYETKKSEFDNLIDLFSENENANGAVIFCGNKLLCADIFNRTEILKEYFPKLLKSAAMEISQLKEKANSLTEAEAFYKTLTLFDTIEKIEPSLHKGIGAGQEKRFSTNELTGFTLEYNKCLIHLTALNLSSGKDKSSDKRRNGIH